MNLEEIRVRASHWVVAIYERRQVARDGYLAQRRSNVRFAPGISGGRFFNSMQRPHELRAALETSFASECSAAMDRAEELRRHRVTIFSHVYDVGATINWHADPRTGWAWPPVYHGDVLRSPGPQGVDVKHVWELNRHQFLIDLATAWLMSHRREYLDEIRDIVRSWVEQNPVGIGVNWSGPLEVAYRALSWLWTAHLVDSGLEEDDDLRTIWASSLYEHAAFLHRHLELYSSPFNHLISEAAVLFILGLVFPQWPEADRWHQRGRHVLEKRLGAQFYADGGNVEQAVGYHHATLGFYVLAVLLARHNRQDLSPSVWHALERAIEWSMWTLQPDGSHPAIGDNDDARPIRFSPLNTWDFRHFQSMGATLFGRPDFKALAGRWHQDGEWLLDAGARARFNALDAAHPAPPSVSLAASGYVVLRSGWDSGADYVCFDVGEMAGGLRTDSLPSAAHGHADCLSVVVTLAGVPVFVDAGLYTYNADADWERLFRATEMHNTVRVDARSQARYFGKMTWAEIPRVTLEGTQLDDRAGLMWARATHDGYARRKNGVSHTRTVLLKPGEYVAIVDELVGLGEHVFDLNYLCPPDRTVERRGNWIGIDNVTMAIAASCPIEVEVAHGDNSTGRAWIAPGLDVLLPASKVRVSGRFQAAGVTLLTLVGSSSFMSGERAIDENQWPSEIRPACALLRQIGSQVGNSAPRATGVSI